MMVAPGNCTRVSALVGAFIDGELGHTDRLLVARHCDHCPRCDAELQAARTIKVGLNQLSAPACSDHLLNRLRANVDHERRTTVRQYATIGLLATVTATAAALIVGGFFAPPAAHPAHPQVARTDFPSEQAYVGDPYAPASNAYPVSLRQ